MDDIESFDDDIDSSRGELDELDKILEEFLYDDPIESLTAEQKAFAIINEILNEKSSNSQHKATKPHEELNVSGNLTAINVRDTTEKSGIDENEVSTTKLLNHTAGKHMNINEIAPNNFNIFSDNKELAKISVKDFNKRTVCLTSQQKKLLVAKRRLIKNRKYAEKSRIFLDIDIQNRKEILSNINCRNSILEKTIENYKENMKNLQEIIYQIKKYFY